MSIEEYHIINEKLQWNTNDPVRHSIRVIKNSWQYRECVRLADGTYRPLPDYFPRIMGHFLHASSKDARLVAFTENDEKGNKDIQTIMKPGRYLTKYFKGSLAPAEIVKIVHKIGLDDNLALRFAMDREDIRWVYERGPQSCMSASNVVNKGVHAAEVYAAGDLAVAYIKSGDRALARVLTWPDHLVYIDYFYPKYGHEHYEYSIKLKEELREIGYSQGSLNGARLLKIKCKDKDKEYIMPYLDTNNFIEHNTDDSLFVMTSGEGYRSDRTTGLASLVEQGGCDECEECTRLDNMYGYNGNNYCEDCYSNLFSNCNECGNTFRQGNLSYHNGDDYCQRCYSNLFGDCNKCGNTFRQDSLSHYEVLDACICEDCAAELIAACEICEGAFAIGDIAEIDDSSYCPSCAEKHLSTCDMCEDTFVTGTMVPHGDDIYCAACLEDHRIERNPDCKACEPATEEEIVCLS
mgnify:FL=1